jgi:hypothetical protein
MQTLVIPIRLYTLDNSMAQTAIETDESTDGDAPRCQYCGDGIPGTPWYPFRDVIRRDGAFTYKDDADGPFCDVTCQRAYDADARAE